MSRFLQYFNFVGVLALTALCVFQWIENRRLNLEAGGLEKMRLEHVDQIKSQEKALAGLASDLDGFREQVARSSTSLRETESRTATAEGDLRRLLLEQDRLQTAVSNWVEAVAIRDEQLKNAAGYSQQLTGERNDIVLKFNELIEKHNGVVSQLNALSRDYNALIETQKVLAKTPKTDASP